MIGPQVLGLVYLDGFLSRMYMLGMAATLLMAGMELEFNRIRGRLLSLAVRAWAVSLALARVLTSGTSALHRPLRTPER